MIKWMMKFFLLTAGLFVLIPGARVVKATEQTTISALNQQVNIELECTDDAGGWNNNTIPVYLIDSDGKRHQWDVSKDSLDSEGKRVSHTFEIGSAGPVAVYAYPDFGGGFTVRDMSLRVRMWLSDSGSAIESSEVTIRSWPFVSSLSGGDYMHIAFGNVGSSRVGTRKEDGSLEVKKICSKCSEAFETAKSIGDGAVIVIDSVWITENVLELTSGKVTIDLNGYPIIRSIKDYENDGGVFEVSGSGILSFTDSNPSRANGSGFTGGSIQGGRSSNTGGLIQVEDGGTLQMTGGTLYNGGTTDKGGAIQCDDATVTLNKTLVKMCSADKATFIDNDGGAIVIKDDSTVTLVDCSFTDCHVLDYGGAICQNDGKLYCQNVSFQDCDAKDRGGAIHIGSDSETRLYDCTFIRNKAKSDGGAISIDGSDVEMRNITMENNHSDEAGGAIWVNDKKVFLSGCTIQNNTSADDGGGIYVDSYYDLNVQGKVIVKGNTDENGMSDVMLQDGVASQARIRSGGLTTGSRIGLNKTSNLTSETKLVEGVTFYEADSGFFFADRGRLDFDSTGQQTEIYMATAVTQFHYALYILIGLELVGAGAILIPLFRKKRRLNREKENH